MPRSGAPGRFQRVDCAGADGHRRMMPVAQEGAQRCGCTDGVACPCRGSWWGRARWSAARGRLIEVPERLLFPGVVVRVDRRARRCGSERGGARGESQAPEDLAGHRRVFDGSEQTHPRAAARTAKRIDLENTLEELGPGGSPRHGSVGCRSPTRARATRTARLHAARSGARIGTGGAVGMGSQRWVVVAAAAFLRTPRWGLGGTAGLLGQRSGYLARRDGGLGAASTTRSPALAQGASTPW
jgi:hypothetical protein